MVAELARVRAINGTARVLANTATPFVLNSHLATRLKQLSNAFDTFPVDAEV